jgi:S-DNA-T family DNA segregation ATPase FtsK/SpoIIIE
LLRHFDRPVRLRTVCTLLLPLVAGVLCHVLLCKQVYQLGTDLTTALWQDGQKLLCGGAVSGLLAVVLEVGLGKVVSGILFGAVLIACCFGAFHITPEKIKKSVEERRVQRTETEEAGFVDEDEELVSALPTKKTAAARKTPRSVIDIPLDDPVEPVPVLGEKERKGFFVHKDEAVRTPDQVLRDEQPESGEQPVAEEKKRRRKTKELSREEVQEAADEVSRAIEGELAEAEEAYQYPPITLLEQGAGGGQNQAGIEQRKNALRLAQTLRSFGVDAKAGEVVHGPATSPQPRFETRVTDGLVEVLLPHAG